MANTYSAPNFNIDTDCNVADLTTLKGSAPTVSDYIYVFNGATLTIEQNLSCFAVMLGQTSAGAASAGQRYGYVVGTTGGITITFEDDAGATNTGIIANPTSADSSSKDCGVTLTGASGNNITITNPTDSATSDYWTIYLMYFGTCDITYVTAKYYRYAFVLPRPHSSYSNATALTVSHCEFYPGNRASEGAAVFCVWAGNQAITIPFDLTYNTYHCDLANHRYFAYGGDYADTGHEVDLSGLAVVGAGEYELSLVCRLDVHTGSTAYFGTSKYEIDSDIRPSVPTFTGTPTVARSNSYNRLDIDISGCTTTGADSIEIYAREGSSPTTADYTYLAGIGDPADSTIYLWMRPDGTPLAGDATVYIKLLARNTSGTTENATEMTIQPWGYLVAGS